MSHDRGQSESPSGTRGSTILVVNTLERALKHYVAALAANLRSGGHFVVIENGNRTEGLTRLQKVGAVFHLFGHRLCNGNTKYDRTFVVWPTFGIADVLTWIPWSFRSRVSIFIHDITPLRDSVGYGKFWRPFVRFAIETFRIEIIVHTVAGAEELRAEWGLTAEVVPHPVSVKEKPKVRTNGELRVVRVLGQFKPARTLDPLLLIADSANDLGWKLQIVGRSWPPVKGWEVHDEFVSEEVFENLIATSDCILIPYAYFYQSGVAVRALESAVPVVSPRHPHIEQLYGNDWLGLVETTDWQAAILRVLAVDDSELRTRALAVEAEVVSEWDRYLACKVHAVLTAESGSGDLT